LAKLLFTPLNIMTIYSAFQHTFFAYNYRTIDMKKVELFKLMEQLDEYFQNILLDVYAKDDECFYCDCELNLGTTFILKDSLNNIKLICVFDNNAIPQDL
jgi:hypothetical protein